MKVNLQVPGGILMKLTILVTLLSPAAPVILIGGFIFGKWIGTILVVFSLSIGATFLYIIAK